jgi:hypothetical protein
VLLLRGSSHLDHRIRREDREPLDLNLLYACRQVYAETRELILNVNTIRVSLRFWYAYQPTANTTAAFSTYLATIRKLEVTFQRPYFSRNLEHFPRPGFERLGKFSALKVLVIVVHDGVSKRDPKYTMQGAELEPETSDIPCDEYEKWLLQWARRSLKADIEITFVRKV